MPIHGHGPVGAGSYRFTVHGSYRFTVHGSRLGPSVQSGSGPIRAGSRAAEGARISGAARIIGVDLNQSRFNEAKKFGVTEFVNPKDYDKPVQEVIAEMTDGGVDRSIECTGNVNAMISAFECVHDGWGVAVLVGVPNKDDAFKTHPVNLLNERTLKGTFFGNYKPRSDIPNVVEKYMNKELELEKFITHRIPFSEINKAFDYMLKGESLRCIITMDNNNNNN
ncbi:hypothetical protein ABFS83_14G307800 [Erythranthe nasuta]